MCGVFPGRKKKKTDPFTINISSDKFLNQTGGSEMLRLISFFSLAIVLLAGISSAGLYEPTVILSDYEVSPSVLMPGDTGMITVTLSNTASVSTKTVTDSYATTQTDINPTITGVFLDGGRYIDVTGGNSAFSGDLGAKQSVKLTFAIKAPDGRGIYYAALRVGVKDSENLVYPIPINVDMPVSSLKKPVLLVSQSGSTTLDAGEKGIVSLHILNSGKSTAEDILIKISEESSSLAPIGKSSFHIPSLSSGESKSFDVSFISDKNIETGISEIPLIITYSIVDGTEQTQEDAIVLNVIGSGEIAIASLKTDPARVMENDRFDLTIRIENTGTGDAKSTKASTDLPFTGGREAFIGKIRPGNDAPAVFTLDAKSPGDYTYNFTVVWEDDTGVHESKNTLTLTVRQKDDGAGAAILIFIIIAAAAGGYYWFVYRKKEEEKA